MKLDRLARCVGAAWLFVTAACAEEHPPPGTCGGEVPADLGSCRRGLFWADCGGDGQPTLACDELGGRCLWFTHGCAPDGYHASDCPAGDPCCGATADGSWPFTDGWIPTAIPPPIPELVEDVAAMGRAPLTDASPSTIAVTVDPSFVPGERGVSCDSPEVLQICQEGLFYVDAMAWGGSVSVRVRSRGLLADALHVEIVPSTDARPVARAFVRTEPDAFPPDPPLACESAITPEVELTGRLTLDRIDLDAPSTMHGHLELDVAGAGSVSVLF